MNYRIIFLSGKVRVVVGQQKLQERSNLSFLAIITCKTSGIDRRTNCSKPVNNFDSFQEGNKIDDSMWGWFFWSRLQCHNIGCYVENNLDNKYYCKFYYPHSFWMFFMISQSTITRTSKICPSELCPWTWTWKLEYYVSSLCHSLVRCKANQIHFLWKFLVAASMWKGQLLTR